MIPQETIERIRDASDLVAIIGESVKLRRVGSDFRGPCPFHGGKNPNFSVSTRNTSYHCFKCGESGDVFTFLQKHLGMDWPTAVRNAADRAGIAIIETRGSREEQRDPREPVWALLGAAGELFKETLWSTDGTAAQAYLASRGLDKVACERFEIGYAPADADVLRIRLGALGYNELQLVEAGLLVKREEETRVRARFRNRVMFPISDASGHPVGFGGRLLGPGEPKYLNSSDSPVFSKGQLLYGLNWAKNSLRKEDAAMVVEGYMDVIRCHLAGATHAVAGLGTALTEGQAQLLTRYTKNVYLLYDSDEAGQKATFKAGRALLLEKANVNVVSLPDGDDPDTFVQKYGRTGLDRALHGATDVFDRQIQLMDRKGWFANLAKSRGAIDRVLPTLRDTADPVQRALYIARLSDVTRVPVALIEQEVDAAPRQRRGPAAPAGVTPTRQANPQASRNAPPSPNEMPYGPVGDDDPHIYDAAPRDSVYEVPVVPPPPLDAVKWSRKIRARAELLWRYDSTKPRASHGNLVPGPELSLVVCLIQDRRLVGDISERLRIELVEDPRLRAILETLIAEGSDAPLDAIEFALDRSAPFAVAAYHEVVTRAETLAPGAAKLSIDGAVNQVRIRQLSETLRYMGKLLADADAQSRADIYAEQEEIRSELRPLKAARSKA